MAWYHLWLAMILFLPVLDTLWPKWLDLSWLQSFRRKLKEQHFLGTQSWWRACLHFSQKECSSSTSSPGIITNMEPQSRWDDFVCCEMCFVFPTLLKTNRSRNLDNPWNFQVLRQGIRKILASCAIRGYSSVALPMLGTGAVLRFPHSVVSKVVLEEVRVFEQNQVSRTSFRVRIVIHPNDKESSKVKKMQYHCLIIKSGVQILMAL